MTDSQFFLFFLYCYTPFFNNEFDFIGLFKFFQEVFYILVSFQATGEENIFCFRVLVEYIQIIP